MSASLSRLMIYALIASIEDDLRSVIFFNCGSMPESGLTVGRSMIDNAKLRFEAEKDTKPLIDKTIGDLCVYFDFSDTYKFLREMKDYLPDELNKTIKSVIPLLEKIAPIRNRVMHVRPLLFDDLPVIFDRCNILCNKDRLLWRSLDDTLKKLETNPGFVLSLEIPVDSLSTTNVSHNLPLPDFDETGLIGRDEILKQIKKTCLGPYPIISIVGEGGVGKSALALKLAYDMLDDPLFDFDSVMWVSSKTTQISLSEIKEINGAIKTSLGLFTELSQSLTGSIPANPVEEVLEYLESFKILLFIDNLETVIDAQIKDFLQKIPHGSKIIITSRIGLGAYEVPMKLAGLDDTNACKLMRQLANVRQVDILKTATEKILHNYCERLHNNPGYIKWFVSAVRTGLPPENVLQNSNVYLEFCMSNVYEYLSGDAKKLLSVFVLVSKWLSLAELAFFLNEQAVVIQKAIQELLTTNMLVESSRQYQHTIKTTYKLADLPKSFLIRGAHSISKEMKEAIRKSENQLRAIQDFQGQSSENQVGRYNPRNIKIRDKQDRLIARQLVDIMKSISHRDFDSAFRSLDEVKRLAPDYYEVHRVSAYYSIKTNDYEEARASFEIALTQNTNSPELYYWYGNFLLRDDSIEEALEKLNIAQQLDENSYEIIIALSRCHLYLYHFDIADQLLEQIEPIIKNGTMPNWQLKYYYDLKFQCYYRHADWQQRNGDINKSVDLLYGAYEHYCGIPEQLKDDGIMQTLYKVANLVRIINTRKRKDVLESVLDKTNKLNELIVNLPLYNSWKYDELFPSNKDDIGIDRGTNSDININNY